MQHEFQGSLSVSGVLYWSVSAIVASTILAITMMRSSKDIKAKVSGTHSSSPISALSPPCLPPMLDAVLDLPAPYPAIQTLSQLQLITGESRRMNNIVPPSLSLLQRDIQ